MTTQIGSIILATVTEKRNDHVLLRAPDGVECFLDQQQLVYKKGGSPAKALAEIKVDQEISVEITKEVTLGDKRRYIVSAFKVAKRERDARRAVQEDVLTALRAGEGMPGIVKSKKPGAAYVIVSIQDDEGQNLVDGIVPASFMLGEDHTDRRNRCDMIDKDMPLDTLYLVEEKIKEGRVHRTFSEFPVDEGKRKCFADNAACRAALEAARGGGHSSPAEEHHEDGSADGNAAA